MNGESENTSPVILRSESPEDLVRAATMLRDGKVLAVPTETVYGLAASIFRPEAIDRVVEMKGRAATAPLPILMGSAADLPLLCRQMPRLTWRLIEHFWPGALTLALPARLDVDRRLRAVTGTVACRVPANKACLEMLEALGAPVTGTSANRSGHEPSALALEAAGSLSIPPDGVLLDDDHVTGGAASTVVEVRDTFVVVLREGPVRIEDLRQATGARIVRVEELDNSVRPR
jgi:L-threonylcarbamoyladenylate synthase